MAHEYTKNPAALDALTSEQFHVTLSLFEKENRA